MGSQTTFYAMPTDIDVLTSNLRSLEPSIAFLHGRSANSKPRIVETVNEPAEGSRWLQYYLARRADVSLVQTSHVPAQGYWTIDELRSPVVEFSLCFFDGLVLRRGRVYFQARYYDVNDHLVEKPDDFRAWASSVLRCVRRTFTKRNDEYYGEGALSWVEQGGRIE